MTVVHIIEGRQKRIEKGHPWVYKTEIARIDGTVQEGETVDVVDFRQRFLGRGFINPRSMLTVRIMTHQREQAIDEALIRSRLQKAWSYRHRILFGKRPLAELTSRACRVVFGEADLLPGLIVDKFADHLVVQTLALGIDRWKETIIDELSTLLHPAGIYERNDQAVRELEGLEQRQGCVFGHCRSPVTIKENEIRVLVDISGGQKTGYFLDQQDNRRAIRPFVQGARVLDCFCHTGSFALHAAAYGAKNIDAVDISADALQIAQKNADLNGFNNINFLTANAFDELRRLSDTGASYDVIILDPPAFTKSKSSLQGASRGYKEINLRAMKLLGSGGFLITNSCSYYMPETLFLEILEEAARDAKKRIRLVELRRQAPDHPMLAGYPESFYLKCAILEVY